MTSATLIIVYCHEGYCYLNIYKFKTGWEVSQHERTHKSVYFNKHLSMYIEPELRMVKTRQPNLERNEEKLMTAKDNLTMPQMKGENSSKLSTKLLVVIKFGSNVECVYCPGPQIRTRVRIFQAQESKVLGTDRNIRLVLRLTCSDDEGMRAEDILLLIG